MLSPKPHCLVADHSAAAASIDRKTCIEIKRWTGFITHHLNPLGPKRIRCWKQEAGPECLMRFVPAPAARSAKLAAGRALLTCSRGRSGRKCEWVVGLEVVAVACSWQIYISLLTDIYIHITGCGRPAGTRVLGICTVCHCRWDPVLLSPAYQ